MTYLLWQILGSTPIQAVDKHCQEDRLRVQQRPMLADLFFTRHLQHVSLLAKKYFVILLDSGVYLTVSVAQHHSARCGKPQNPVEHSRQPANKYCTEKAMKS
jgi:hypothetical protein